jgi:hypothetical protein
VDGDGVSVRVGEGESPPEGSVERRHHDRDAVRGEPVVHFLGVVGAQPQHDAGARPRRHGVQVDTGQRFPYRERDGLGGEDDGVWRGAGRPLEAEVGLVEVGGFVEVADLQADEVGSGDSHESLPGDVNVLTRAVCVIMLT